MSQDIAYDAAENVRTAIASLGRTEDLAFSPNARRIAVACFSLQRLSIFDLAIASGADTPRVALTGGVHISSALLNHPHGVDFIDDDHVIVANRAGTVAVFEVPPGAADMPHRRIEPSAQWAGQLAGVLNAPGSVAVSRLAAGGCEVLVCNNDGHNITRHTLKNGVPQDTGVVIQKYLDLPDGVAVSHDRRWIAVSNHNAHRVLVYENSETLNPNSEPAAILRRVSYPHGLAFDAEGHHLFVADAGTPYIHVFTPDSDGWRGVRTPLASLRAMGDAQFQRGHHSDQEGGPKGLAIAPALNLLAVTSEKQPLSFFDTRRLLQCARSGHSKSEERALEVEHELDVMKDSHRTMATIRYMRASRSWRMTSVLRRVESLVRRHV